MKVALVYDRVNKWGGAERVLLALHKLWPDAPLFTAVYDKKRAAWADVFLVYPSFLQRIPGASFIHESLPGLTPMAFESFTFDEYDVVISVTSAEAKNILTKPGTTHICYCLTPTRYLWSGFLQYQNQPGLGILSNVAAMTLKVLAPILRKWDIVAASRPDYYVAISHRVKERIKRYYHRDTVAVIYPPVDIQKFHISALSKQKDSGYFLTVSRLVSYKRLDILIEAFNTLKLPLVIIGDGRMKRELTRMASSYIRFVDHHLTDSELVLYYEGCRAFVYAADEDFGLAAAEAQAAGKPVIAYRDSGVSEFVKDGVSGVLFDQQTSDAIENAVKTYLGNTYSPSACRKQVVSMSSKNFQKHIKTLVASVEKL
jgi:glycosyltransferase involved in cell wall biosynthesis